MLYMCVCVHTLPKFCYQLQIQIWNNSSAICMGLNQNRLWFVNDVCAFSAVCCSVKAEIRGNQLFIFTGGISA